MSQRRYEKMNIDLITLEDFLHKASVPDVIEKPLTFLAISKQPHYENVWSNIYAFFLNTEAEHNLNDLFISSLLSLINDIKPNFQFSSDFNVETECGTNKNGRIDILLSSVNGAIIIENKVHHYLANDLDDYWNSVDNKNKVGVLLYLHKKYDIKNNNFIAITHFDFFRKVMENLQLYEVDSTNKFIVFLKDFHQNIINITTPMDKNIIKFYQDNLHKINQINNVRNTFVKYVVSEIENAVNDIDEKLVYNSNRNEKFRYYRCPTDGNLLITIYFKNLILTGQEIFIIVEFKMIYLK